MENQIKQGKYLLSLDETDKEPFYKVLAVTEDSSKITWVKLEKMVGGQVTESPLLYVQEEYIEIKESTVKILFGNKLEKEIKK